MGAFENQIRENETFESLMALYKEMLDENIQLREELRRIKEGSEYKAIFGGLLMPTQCQVMKPNGMQCDNPAFAQFNKVPYCLLHLNAKMNDELTIKTLVTPEQFKLIDPTAENKATLEKIINFTNTTITNAT